MLDTALEENTTIVYEEVIHVKGKIEFKDKEAVFEFKVKIKDISKEDRQVINKASATLSLKFKDNKEVELSEDELIITQLKNVIKNHDDYKAVIRGQITLKDNKLTLENSAGNILEDTDTVSNKDIITIKGVLVYKTYEKDFTFSFTVKVKTKF